jgi:hypothetical protein
MNRKKFIEQVRHGSASFRVDEVKVRFPSGEVSGSGALELSQGQFRLNLRLSDGILPLQTRGGVLTKKDFGSLEGIIDHDVPFQVKNLPPHHEYSSHNGRLTLRYDLDAIELSPIGSDTQTYDQIRRSLELLESSEPTEESTVETAVSEQKTSCVTFSGLLLGFKLIARNAATRIEEHNDFLGDTTSTRNDTQCGDLSDDWEYGLIERGEDVAFHLHLKDGRKSGNTSQDLAVLDAFLKAVAFIHGQHAWPFTLQFRRDHKLITDRVRPPKVAKRSPHQPFNERIWFNAVVGNLQWDFGTALQKAYTFFHEENELSAEVSQLLFLCREAAGGDAYTTITNIALCSLLDSAVNLVFDAEIETREAKAMAGFNDARSTLLDFIAERIATIGDAENEPWKRFHSILSNSEFVAAREKFRAVGEFLGLKWEGDWQEVYRFWAKWRPRLVHRGTASADGEEEIAAEFNVGSRVIGAIHMLVLKLMGYEGIMLSSAFEDQFRKI